MRLNVGKTDRFIRLTAGGLVLLLGAAGYAGLVPVASIAPQALTSLLLVLVGIIIFFTGVTEKCPVYAALGYNTRED